MPAENRSEFWEDDPMKLAHETNELSDEIVRLWPAHEQHVRDILDAPELDAPACYQALQELHGTVLDTIKRANIDSISPWPPRPRSQKVMAAMVVLFSGLGGRPVEYAEMVNAPQRCTRRTSTRT